MSLNKVMLIGSVGKDPEIKDVGGSKCATFSLATTEKYKDRNGEYRENTEWHNVTCWRGPADVVEKYVKKGSMLFIEGKLQTREWTDRDGNKRRSTGVVVDNIQLLYSKPNNNARSSRDDEF